MDDIMIIEYLKRKGIYNLTDDEFNEKFKDVLFHHYMKDYKSHNYACGCLEEIKHFTEEEARNIVSEMYHYSCDNTKYSGEVFSMERAEEIHNMYKECLMGKVTVTDVYIAINAQYHDYIELFKRWFSNSLDSKIIESAIVFWFKDEDYKMGNKVYKYFSK